MICIPITSNNKTFNDCEYKIGGRINKGLFNNDKGIVLFFMQECVFACLKMVSDIAWTEYIAEWNKKIVH